VLILFPSLGKSRIIRSRTNRSRHLWHYYEISIRTG